MTTYASTPLEHILPTDEKLWDNTWNGTHTTETWAESYSVVEVTGAAREPAEINMSITAHEGLVNRTVSNDDYPCVIMTMMTFNDNDIVTSQQVFFFSSLVCVVVGLVGNGLSIAVFSSREMRPLSSNFYLLILAISDSCYLLAVFISKPLTTLRCWYLTDSAWLWLDIINRSSAVCKLIQYMVDLFSDYSTTIILAFTVERFIAVYAPVRFKELCTLRRARISSVVLLAVIAVMTAPHHILYIDLHLLGVCTIVPEHEQTFLIFYVIEAALCRVIPVFAISTLNIFIVKRVLKVTRAKVNRTSEQYQLNETMKGNGNIATQNITITKATEATTVTPATASAAISPTPTSTTPTETLTPSLKMTSPKRTSPKTSNTIKNHYDRSRQVTLMLIAVSSCYVIAYLPVLVHYILDSLERDQRISLSQKRMLVAQSYTRALYVAGFAINFFLYTLSGRVFRRQLVTVLFAPAGRSLVNCGRSCAGILLRQCRGSSIGGHRMMSCTGRNGGASREVWTRDAPLEGNCINDESQTCSTRAGLITSSTV